MRNGIIRDYNSCKCIVGLICVFCDRIVNYVGWLEYIYTDGRELLIHDRSLVPTVLADYKHDSHQLDNSFIIYI